MEINNIPDMFQSRIRLAVVASLLTGAKTFNELKASLQTTDGNLSVHLTKLEESNYISSIKSFQGKKPLSRYTLTESGRAAFIAYVALLESVVRE